jgi:hypothetical protein
MVARALPEERDHPRVGWLGLEWATS